MLRYFLLVICISSSLLGKAQKQYQVLDWKTDVTLNTYLVQHMKVQYQQRADRFANALATKKSTLAYISEVKAKAKKLFRDLPQKAALQAKITGVIQQEGFQIEKLVYQSFSKHHVTANLYVPQGKGPFAAVLLFCGHEDTAKATESYQKTAVLLVKNGFVVLVIDPISQSERVQLTDKDGQSLTRGATTEHTLLNLQSNLLGTSVAAYQFLDNQCGLDYLLTRKEVNPNQIGCLGNSGGAIQAIYFAALDERIKVVVPCSYLASRENTLATTGAADGCAQIPNEGLLQLEMSDYLIAAAPKPMLVLAGRYDFIDYNGTLQSVADLKKVYSRLNATHQINLFSYDDGHGISKPKREKAVQWFRRWFYQDSREIREGNLVAASEVQLFASSQGKVVLSYPNEVPVQQFNLNMFDAYAAKRAQFVKNTKESRLSSIAKLLNINPSLKKVEVDSVGTSTHKLLNFSKFILRKTDEVPLPVLLYRPQKPVQKVVILLNDGGKNRFTDSLTLLKKYVDEQSTAIILADLRGIGETSDKASFNDPKYFSDDYRNAMLAMHIGKPLMGQRTTDILTLMDFIGTLGSAKFPVVDIVTIGHVGLVAIHASLFDSRITRLELYDCIKSFKEVFEQPLAKNRYGLVVNGIAQYYDIADLVNGQNAQKIKFY